MAPNAATGTTADTGPGARLIAAVTASASSIQVSGSTSTNHGTRPAWITACAVATKVQAGTAQSAPFGRSIACRVRVKAWVALTVVTIRAPSPNRAARRSSISLSSGPKFEYQRAVSMRCRCGRMASAVGSRGRATATGSRAASSAENI